MLVIRHSEVDVGDYDWRDSNFEEISLILAKLTVLLGMERNERASQIMVRVLLTAFGILGVCLVLHIAGILFIGRRLLGLRQKLEERTGFLYAGSVLISVFSALIVLHMIAAAIWAVFYLQAGLFQNFETSLYFSLQSYSTVGYGDVALPQRWRLLGTIEGISGVLLCGLSAGFLFAIVTTIFRFRVQRVPQDATIV
ncbi:MAG TPA: potassium channel family protein [Pyrinomonadaceae bacterium]|nr:potassium channel family protein [Pyrinomonadaceae bacterium]